MVFNFFFLVLRNVGFFEAFFFLYLFPILSWNQEETKTLIMEDFEQNGIILIVFSLHLKETIEIK